MEYTQQQQETFKTEFATRRKRQLLAILPMIPVFLILVTADGNRGEAFGLPLAALLPIALAVVAGVVIFSLRNWRCPACSAYLGKGMSPRFCPKCGVGLQ